MPPLDEQFVQKAPFWPHAVFDEPVTHWPVAMSMHPEHGWHEPFTQVLPFWHATHTEPNEPQRDGVVGV